MSAYIRNKNNRKSRPRRGGRTSVTPNETRPHALERQSVYANHKRPAVVAQTSCSRPHLLRVARRRQGLGSTLERRRVPVSKRVHCHRNVAALALLHVAYAAYSRASRGRCRAEEGKTRHPFVRACIRAKSSQYRTKKRRKKGGSTDSPGKVPAPHMRTTLHTLLRGLIFTGARDDGLSRRRPRLASVCGGMSRPCKDVRSHTHAYVRVCDRCDQRTLFAFMRSVAVLQLAFNVGDTVPPSTFISLMA